MATRMLVVLGDKPGHNSLTVRFGKGNLEHEYEEVRKLMADAGTTHKAPNHDLSEMRCPVGLADVDLFGPGAQEHWYESYEILHAYAPVHCLPGEGMAPGTDAYVLTKHEDIAAVVRDQKRFLLPSSAFVRQLVGSTRCSQAA